MSSEKVTEEMEIISVETPGRGGHLWRVSNPDIVKITVFDQAGVGGYYPWYRVYFKDGMVTEVNSLAVEGVVWRPKATEEADVKDLPSE